MRVFVESLHRLYITNQIKKEQIKDLYDKKKITKDEYEFIIDTQQGG